MKNLIIFIPSIEGGGVEKNLILLSNYLSSKIENISVVTANNDIKNLFSKKVKIICPKINWIFPCFSSSNIFETESAASSHTDSGRELVRYPLPGSIERSRASTWLQ